jgi:hypothetical protein
MLFQEVSKSILCLTLLLLLPTTGNSLNASRQQAGTVAGSMVFVDAHEKTTLGEAAKVTVELEHEEQRVSITSDELGDFIRKLAKGTYCLKSARSADNKPLSFSPNQTKCFTIKPNQDTRFDVMFVES